MVRRRIKPEIFPSLARALLPLAPLLLGAGYSASRLLTEATRTWWIGDSLFDFGLARRIARATNRRGPDYSYDRPWTNAAGRQSADQIAELLQVDWQCQPRAEAIDQDAWIDLNLTRFAQMLQPLAQSSSPAMANPFARAAIGVQIGVLLGFLAPRVLGQFDLPLYGGGGTTFVVESNVARLADRMRVDREQLWRWVVLHEMTHALEFERAAWLAPHLRSLVSRFLASGSDEASGQDGPGDRPGILSFALNDQQRAIVADLQACMSVLEGYANWVMRRVARDHLPTWQLINQRMRARVQSRSLITGLLIKLMGLELKLEQYGQGERFCQLVVENSIPGSLELVWARPQNLPSMDEIADPQRWVSRVVRGGRLLAGPVVDQAVDRVVT